MAVPPENFLVLIKKNFDYFRPYYKHPMPRCGDEIVEARK